MKAGEPENGVVETRSQGKGRREINAWGEGIKIHQVHAQTIQHCSSPICSSLGGYGAIKSLLSFCLMWESRLRGRFQIHMKRGQAIKRKASLEEKKEIDKVLWFWNILPPLISSAPVTPIAGHFLGFHQQWDTKMSQSQLLALEVSSDCFDLAWVGKEPENGGAECKYKAWRLP